MVNLKVWAFQPKAFSGISYLVALAVCYYNKSKWNHVGFSIGSRYYEVDLFKGVQKLNHIPDGAELIYDVWITQNKVKLVTDWADSQIGKSYNLLAMFGYYPNNEEDKKTWFCSEFTVTMLRLCNVKILENVQAWKIFPQQLVSCLCDY